jgi:hypothetical protein
LNVKGVPAGSVVEEPMAMTTVDNVVYVYEVSLALRVRLSAIMGTDVFLFVYIRS